jgi:RHS repeat-associated protein
MKSAKLPCPLGVNQVQDAFNGLGQLITEYQAHSGAVNINTTPKVQYSYTLMAGGVNNSRLTGITYPNGRALTYNYATGIDNTISRLTSISDGVTTLESLSYLGLATVVKRAHPQPGVDLTYIKQTGESNGDAGDQYTGLDRFGRVVDQRWIITANGTATDRFKYGYDRDSNVLYRDNLVNSSFGELYHANGASNGYDLLNQLTDFRRGVLSDTNADNIPDTVTTAMRTQSWGLDALGNWSSVTTDGNTQTRTANQQNEITSISGQTTPGYDANGNMTGDQTGKTLIFDAWNRLIQYKNGATPLETYGYDALGRRITENPGTVRDLYYSMLWQLLEEDVAGSMQDQYVWSPVYVDAVIERDTPTQRLYVQHDANFNVTALVDTSSSVQERYVYDPYGSVTILAANWTTRGSSNYSWVYGHQGGRLDNATGLYAFRNRDFSPTLGRWMENDPLGFGGGDSNFYRAVSNDPIGLLDSFGLYVPGPSPIQDPPAAVMVTGDPSGEIEYIFPDGSTMIERPNGYVYIVPPPPKPNPDGSITYPFGDGSYTVKPDGTEIFQLPDGSQFVYKPPSLAPPNPDGGIWPGLTPEQEQQQAWQNYMDEFDQNWGVYMLGPGGWWYDMWMFGMGGSGAGVKPIEPKPFPEPPEPKPFPARPGRPGRPGEGRPGKPPKGPTYRPGNRPTDAPSGTLPINKHPLTKGREHEVKKCLADEGVGPASFVGISPDGDVIVTNPDGTSYNLGPVSSYLR